MRVSALHHDVTRVEADVLVAPLWEGERPPHGLAGRVDWYLCGFLSRLLLAGRLRGASGETTLIASQGRLGAPRILLLGLGPRGAVGLEAGALHLRQAAAAVSGLRLSSVAIELPAPEAGAGLRPLLRELGQAFAAVLPPEAGEIQVLAASEEEGERLTSAIREVFPRGPSRLSAARPIRS